MKTAIYLGKLRKAIDDVDLIAKNDPAELKTMRSNGFTCSECGEIAFFQKKSSKRSACFRSVHRGDCRERSNDGALELPEGTGSDVDTQDEPPEITITFGLPSNRKPPVSTSNRRSGARQARSSFTRLADIHRMLIATDLLESKVLVGTRQDSQKLPASAYFQRFDQLQRNEHSSAKAFLGKITSVGKEAEVTYIRVESRLSSPAYVRIEGETLRAEVADRFPIHEPHFTGSVLVFGALDPDFRGIPRVWLKTVDDIHVFAQTEFLKILAATNT